MRKASCTLPENTHPEYYYFSKLNYDWHIILNCHNGRNAFTRKDEAGYTARDGKVQDFMIRLQRLMGLRQNEYAYLAADEYGEFDKPHVHILLSFDMLRVRGKLEKLVKASASMQAAMQHLEKDFMHGSLRITFKPIVQEKEDQKRVTSYVCKKEEGYEYKHFFASKSSYIFLDPFSSKAYKN
jgi:hypothetical protein